MNSLERIYTANFVSTSLGEPQTNAVILAYHGGPLVPAGEDEGVGVPLQRPESAPPRADTAAHSISSTVPSGLMSISLILPVLSLPRTS